MTTDLEQSRNCMGNKDLGAPPAPQDRATDAPHEAPAGLRPDGSVSTGAGAFTRGPWAVWSSIYDGWNAAIVSATPEDGPSNTVALAREYRDANLIAAAPELYEALQSQVWALTNLASNVGFSSRDIADMTAQANRALAKARGEQ